MTHEEVMEQVREKLWQLLHSHKKEHEWSGVVLEILSIPEILIKDPNQSLPDNVCEYDDGKDFTIGYKLAQQDMLKENWKKVLPKE